ncbi:MAG: nuclease superfamily protein, partial [Firmicutes bacterium]|nr:nuclease superfamily protein [Bacillota bacterium]
MELDGEQYYREQAAQAKYEDLKTVLIGLAEDEKRHFAIVESLQKQKGNAYIEADPAVSKQRNVFELAQSKDFIPKDKESIAKLKAEQVDVYRAALTKEEESIALYNKLQQTATSPTEKIVLGKLMHEEEKHKEVLDNIIQMFNRVNEWVESPEFHHTKPY